MVASQQTLRSETFNRKRLAGMTKTGNRKLGNCVKNNKTKITSNRAGIEKLSARIHTSCMTLISGIINIIVLKIIEKIIDKLIKKLGLLNES